MCIKNASVHETLKIIERMAGRKNISFIKNDEPAFIKAFKQKVGYKEGPTVDSKVNICCLIGTAFDYH